MKTYLTLWFNSDGSKPTETVKKLEGLGFNPTQGNYDMAYDWGQKASVDDVLKIGDAVQKTLKECKVMFKMETL